MRILSVSWFGFTVLTLAHAVSLPVTDDYPGTDDYPFNPTTDFPVTDDYPVSPSMEDGNYHWDFKCPDGWTKHSTQCLLFVPHNMTWNEAKENCASKGQGSLAGVYDNTQATEIYNEMESAGYHDGQVWVGGSRTSEDSSWSWDDYSFFGFAEFCDGKSANHENNCMVISFNDHGSGCLDGMKCDAGLPSVCAILIY